MPNGIGLAIGLNVVNTSSPAYAGVTVPVLGGCVNDANAIADMLGRRNFSTRNVLTDQQATHAAVLGALDAAAAELSAGDLFVLHYSGHGMKGGIAPQGGIDPESDHTSSWILYDQPFSSDELFLKWGAFKQGVRILVISDSCHSGSAIRDLLPYTTRGLDLDKRTRILSNNQDYYIQGARTKEVLRDFAGTPSAALLLLSGCQEDETSMDTQNSQGIPHGLFTATLLDVLNGGGVPFPGNYIQYHRQVAQQTNARSVQLDRSHQQNPNFFPLGSPLDVMVFSRSSPPFIL